ncbi:MAG TPA: sigma-70 family RNA polymerase sigma factor [Polyangiales bacterium]|nr:sigma-70 family RNA polymerase sigma factor [Polyangiales bacterium]
MTGTTDMALLHAWRDGDTRAGNLLLSRHFQGLLRFFEHKVGPDADELIQRTLLACAESYQRIRGESSFRTYLFTIARHELYRYFRQRSLLRERLDFTVTSLVDMRTSATGRLVQREREAALERALERLPLDDQILLELFYSEDLDSQQLAEVFEIEPSSVRARLHRARASIARML